MIAKRRMPENLAFNAMPTAIPVAIKSHQRGDKKYSQKRYALRKIRRVTPTSVVTREEWATKFGSKDASAIASMAAPPPQSRLAHHPTSAITPTPRNKLKSRLKAIISSACTDDL